MSRVGAGGLVALWFVFLCVHVFTAIAGWLYPNQPMGDVVLVYQPWASSALSGGPIMGITETWVYPQLALIPMLLVALMSTPFVGLLGVSDAYLVAWPVLVLVLDAVAFAVLLGRSPSRSRRGAAWFWSAAILLLGPVALYRIDAVALPLAIVAGLWLSRRPAIAAALLTIAAWIKIWPGAVLLGAVVAARSRGRMLLACAIVAVTVVATLLVLGAREELFGFVSEQTGRGLQIEAVAATPFLWAAVAGEARINYSYQILTFQIGAPMADAVADVLTPLMLTFVTLLLAVGVVKAARGAAAHRLFPPLAMCLVLVLIVANKVGSPQFQTWLMAPALLWIVFDRARSRVPAALVLVLGALTCFVYPLAYDALLRAEFLPVLVITLRNALLLLALVVGVRALLRVPATQSTPTDRK